MKGTPPGGAAIYIEVVTDNRNRAVAEVRSVLTRSGGSLGESGCVAWNFDQRGVLIGALTPEQDADELALTAIDAGRPRHHGGITARWRSTLRQRTWRPASKRWRPRGWR